MGGSHGNVRVFVWRHAHSLAGIWFERAVFAGFSGVCVGVCVVSEGRVSYLLTNCRICQLSYQCVQAVGQR